jgi:hypothetical protein
MGQFVSACDAIRDMCGVTVMGVHHSGKDEARGMRGSSALEGAGDCVIHFKREDDSNRAEVIVDKQKDGEALPPLWFELKRAEWMEGLKLETTLVPELSTPIPIEDSLPDRDTCRRILSRMDEVWLEGAPWSFAPQSVRTGRNAVRNILAEFNLASAATAETLLEGWGRNGIIREDIRDSHSKMKGIRVVGSI